MKEGAAEKEFYIKRGNEGITTTVTDHSVKLARFSRTTLLYFIHILEFQTHFCKHQPPF
jgi:hypothetical protein